MFEGYFDESGNLDQPPGVFCVAGYFLSSDAAIRMDEAWGRVLDDHQIPYFHMVECAHGTGVFADKSKEERIDIETELIQLIKEHTLEGFAALASRDHFNPSDDESDVYTHCAHMGMGALRFFLKTLRIETDIACFFESGHKSKGQAYSRLAKEMGSLSASVTFAEKNKLRLLQAADLLAWQAAKYLKDQLAQARPPRKDFLSLMEHPHGFFHLHFEEGEKSMAMEAWPLSRRSQASASLSLDRDGPMTLFREDGDQMPIIPVSRPLGWRMGGGRMAYVAFKDLGDREFALAFDEPRLLEAILALMSATEIYGGGTHVALLPSVDVRAEEREDRVILTVHLFNGARFALSLEKETAIRLRESLSAAPPSNGSL